MINQVKIIFLLLTAILFLSCNQQRVKYFETEGQISASANLLQDNKKEKTKKGNTMKFYDLSVNTPSGEELKMSDFEGKAVLIVNTATKCGLAPQFDGLEKLHQEYKDNGLVVLGFPSDNFANQEPETNETVVEACRINHGVTFQLTEKVDVNGKNTHPVYEYLKDELGGGLLGKSIKWNFTKFLIGKDGKPFKRYGPTTKPKKIEKDIQKVLN